MKKILALCLFAAIGAVMLSPSTVWAEESNPAVSEPMKADAPVVDGDSDALVPDDAGGEHADRPKFKDMTPEQRIEARKQMREKWQSLTPEQKAAAKEKMNERMDNMSPEQREKAKERHKGMREMRHDKMGHGRDGKAHGDKPARHSPAQSQ